ncbi:MAG: bifunctional phosphoglucose/phosphomannose isomerase [Patescibacteria group bacterium]
MKKKSMALDSPKRVEQLDTQGMVQSIESLALQCEQAWNDVKRIRVPRQYRTVENIVINGMGGSALGGHIIAALFERELKKPLHVVNSYTVPGFVSRSTLYVISSYSGTTEEPVSTFREARKRGAKVMFIGAGGTIAAYAKRYRIPAYIFEPQFNPSGQPRMGLGYSIVGQVALFRRLGLLSVSDAAMRSVVERIIKLHHEYGVRVPASRNAAKEAALALHGAIPVYVGAQHLAGNAHVCANQTNENGKTFAAYFTVSELNHHLMEGLRYPASNPRNLHFVFFESGRYLPKIQKRFTITQKVLRKSGIPFEAVRVRSTSALEQVFEVLVFGSYLSFYLALLRGIDPSPIPFVDYFKKQLQQ